MVKLPVFKRCAFQVGSYPSPTWPTQLSRKVEPHGNTNHIKVSNLYIEGRPHLSSAQAVSGGGEVYNITLTSPGQILISPKHINYELAKCFLSTSLEYLCKNNVSIILRYCPRRGGGSILNITAEYFLSFPQYNFFSKADNYLSQPGS